MRAWPLQGVVEKGFIVDEGENDQRRIEGSRPNMASRTDRAMRGGEWGQRREERRPGPREHMGTQKAPGQNN